MTAYELGGSLEDDVYRVVDWSLYDDDPSCGQISHYRRYPDEDEDEDGEEDE
jgi:hypothetical protein